MSENQTNVYIDGANLHRGSKSLNSDIDYKRFRVWLNDKFHSDNVYLYIGYIKTNRDLYSYLQEAGFILKFKPTIPHSGGIKVNCDADMVLDIVKDYYENKYKKAVLVTSDGDFYSVIEFLKNNQALERVISPTDKCSILIKEQNIPITYLRDIYKKIKPFSNKRKTPYKH